MKGVRNDNKVFLNLPEQPNLLGQEVQHQMQQRLVVVVQLLQSMMQQAQQAHSNPHVQAVLVPQVWQQQQPTNSN